MKYTSNQYAPLPTTTTTTTMSPVRPVLRGDPNFKVTPIPGK